jgi:hypothetical protein
MLVHNVAKKDEFSNFHSDLEPDNNQSNLEMDYDFYF